MMVKDNELGRLDAIFHQNDVRLALVGTKRWTPHMYSLQCQKMDPLDWMQHISSTGVG